MPMLDWLGKAEALKAAQQVKTRLLEPVPELSAGDLTAQNLLIQGDNLEALKALLPIYAGQVKCIFIDPPYNTGSAFEHYDDNLEHSTWLSMMYPRLELLRELLREDGSIWITIDDKEGHYLKLMMDEVFGRRNFMANAIWRSSDNSNNDAKTFSTDHNQLLVFSKSGGWTPNRLDQVGDKRSHFKNPDNDPRGPWFDGNPLNSPKPRKNLQYSLPAPNGNLIPHPKNGWRWELPTMLEKIASGEIRFNESMTNIRRRTYLYEMKGLPPSTLWTDLDITGHNRQAKAEQVSLLEGRVEPFATPKPEKLLRQVILLATEVGDLVLDSFLGSGTTAAVAHKMGRRYIGIEMGDHAMTHCAPRLRKVIDGEQGGISEAVGWKGGGGFRFLRLGEPLFDAMGLINASVTFQQLASFVWFSETRAPLTEVPSTPRLGVHEGVAIDLLYNGILGDKRPQGGNVLTSKMLQTLPSHEGPRVIYGEATRLGPDRLRDLGITFKQTPFDLKVR